MTNLRNRGYVQEEELTEAAGINDALSKKIKTMFRDGDILEAWMLLAKTAAAKKAEKKIGLIMQLKVIEDGFLPYELENYLSIVTKELIAVMKEKFSKEQLKMFPILVV